MTKPLHTKRSVLFMSVEKIKNRKKKQLKVELWVFLVLVIAVSLPNMYTPHMLKQCFSHHLFSHGQTNGCTGSLLDWMGFISLRLKGIVKKVFTNQFYTQRLNSVTMHTHSTLIQFYGWRNFCKILAIHGRCYSDVTIWSLKLCWGHK